MEAFKIGLGRVIYPNSYADLFLGAWLGVMRELLAHKSHGWDQLNGGLICKYSASKIKNKQQLLVTWLAEWISSVQ